MPKCKDCVNHECVCGGATTRLGTCEEGRFVERAEATKPSPVSPSNSSDLLNAFVAGAVWREKHFTGKEMSLTDKQLALTTAECMNAAGVITYVKGI